MRKYLLSITLMHPHPKVEEVFTMDMRALVDPANRDFYTSSIGNSSVSPPHLIPFLGGSHMHRLSLMSPPPLLHFLAHP